MRKVIITALIAAGGFAAAAPAAQAEGDVAGPCAIAINLIYKYDLYPEPGPHFPELDTALRLVCGVTG